MSWISSLAYLSFVLTFPPSAFPSSSVQNRIKLKAVPPVYSVEIKDVTLYEATIPIFFHVKLPTIPDVFPTQNIHTRNCSLSVHNKNSSGNEHIPQFNDYQCALERQFILASNHIVKDLKEQLEKVDSPEQVGNSSESNNTSTRRKRQAAPVLAATTLIAGFLLRPAITKFTGNLFGSDQEWTSNFNSLRESLIKDHELLLDFEESTQAYTEEMSTILTSMSELLTEQKRDLILSLHLLATKMHTDMIQNAVHSCKTKHLPGNLIKSDYLRKVLSALDKNLTHSINHTLAIGFSEEEMGKYYKLPIVDCLFTKDKAHITLNVPLKRNKADWKLFEIIHTKYAYHHQVCEVYPQEASYLAEEVGTGTSHSILITKHMLRYCSIYEDKLCMVPRFGRDSAQSLKCTAASVNNRRDALRREEDLLKSCSFRCYPSDEVIITQVDDTKIVVTNAKTLSYQCSGGRNKTAETLIHVERLGAVEIDLKCDCSIKIDGKELLSNPFPCATSDENGNSMFTFTVPFVWAHNLLQIMEQDEDSHLFVNGHDILAAHVNPGWPKLVPVLNFTKQQEERLHNFTVPEEAVVQDASIMMTVEVWLAILTLIVVLHLGLTFYCCFRMFMVRFAEYEMAPYREQDPGGWFSVRRRSHSSERSHRHNHHHSNRNSYSHSNSNDDSNRKHNFDTFLEKEESQVVVKLRNEVKSSTSASSAKSEEDSYENNRHSVSNRLI